MQRPSNIVEKFVVSADGTKVFGGAVGDSEKPALIFVHGYSLTSSVFNNFFANPENSVDFYLVRFDLRGHGRTAKPNIIEGYSSQKHAEDYAAIVKGFNAKTPVVVGWSWGGRIPGDIATHLPPHSMYGAVYIASHPTLRSALPLAILPGFAPIWNTRYDAATAATEFPVAFNRLCVARDPSAPPSYYEETIKQNDDGADFVPENPAATHEIRSAMIGMMATMKPLHRKLVSEQLNDKEGILHLLDEGFPILEIIGTHDSFICCEKIVESLKPIAKNLNVHVMQGASHTPFVDAPDEVMGAILKLAKKIHGNGV